MGYASCPAQLVVFAFKTFARLKVFWFCACVIHYGSNPVKKSEEAVVKGQLLKSLEIRHLLLFVDS